MSKNVLRAVHDDDLEKYLESLGLLSDVQAERLRCKFCESPVNLTTLHALFPQSGMIHVVCSKPECIRALMQYVSQR